MWSHTLIDTELLEFGTANAEGKQLNSENAER
jgi:hypothetical protein